MKNTSKVIEGDYICDVSYENNGKNSDIKSEVKHLPFWDGYINNITFSMLANLIGCTAKVSTDDYFLYLLKDGEIFYETNPKSKSFFRISY